MNGKVVKAYWYKTFMDADAVCFYRTLYNLDNDAFCIFRTNIELK